jgi:hypothetical protein
METIDSKLVLGGLKSLLSELVHGPSGGASWVINSGDKGLLETLDSLSPEEASEKLIPNRSSIAGHADHLRFSLNLVNRWAGGENPFADADWQSSWQNQQVDSAKWDEIRRQLREEAQAWLDTVDKPREWDAISLTGTLGTAPHLGYHLGAIRQLVGHLGH